MQLRREAALFSTECGSWQSLSLTSFPEVVVAIAAMPGTFLADRELIVLVEKNLSFDALQARLPSANEPHSRALAGDARATHADRLPCRGYQDLGTP